jgi:uncharacterized damage-inducible protein DinB
MASAPEFWLRGPIVDVPALLQPVAHALLQANLELNEELKEFPDALLWEKPADVASVGFHLQHLRGVLDRLFTYAAGLQLSPDQLQSLKDEGSAYPGNETVAQLLSAFTHQVEHSIGLLKSTNEDSLTEHRGVGRAMIPSTVAGLLFHAAEHTMRHTGQLLVTAKILKAK